MDCKDFREKHLCYVDEMLAGVEVAEMRDHTAECARCAEHDAHIRRALFLVRNLPTIQPSADFSARLHVRLKASLSTIPEIRRIRRRVTAGFLAAAAAMLGYIAVTLYKVERTEDVRMQPVVASTPESELAPIVTPAAGLVASAPAGLGIWSAALFAEQAPVHFAHARLAETPRNR